MTAATTERLVPAGTWAIDDAHSSANFEVEHGGRLRSSAAASSRSTRSSSPATTGSTLEGIVAVEAINVDDENIRPHLLSPDFFDVERNPEIRFRSTEIDGSADDLRGRAASSRWPASRSRSRPPAASAARSTLGEGIEKLSLSLETTIDRTAFGMNWQMELPGGEPGARQRRPPGRRARVQSKS